MSRYIDADKIVITAERGRSADGLIFIPMIDAYRSIDATPTADVVEVVRCKDCKHYKDEQSNCWLMRVKMQSTDYCSYGERKEENEG